MLEIIISIGVEVKYGAAISYHRSDRPWLVNPVPTCNNWKSTYLSLSLPSSVLVSIMEALRTHVAEESVWPVNKPVPEVMSSLLLLNANEVESFLSSMTYPSSISPVKTIWMENCKFTEVKTSPNLI